MKSIYRDVVNLLKEKKLKISAAESCTGGLFAKCITDCPGSSSVLDESYVTYSPEAKIKLVGVKSSTIDNFTVVSKEVAYEMAEGVMRASSADIGVSFTGYAGPDGEKVGLVFTGIAFKDKVLVFELNLSGSREEIRNQAVDFTFLKISEIIKEL